MCWNWELFLPLFFFNHPSLQTCSRSFKLWGDLLCTAFFKSFQRFLIGFRSGLYLGYSKLELLLMPFLWWHGFALWVIAAVLEGEMLNHLQLSNRGMQVWCQTLLVFGAIYDSLYLEESISPSWREKQHRTCEAATTMLHWRYDVLWLISSLVFASVSSSHTMFYNIV